MSYPRRNDLSLTPHGSQLSPTSTQSIATQIPYSYGTGQLAAAGFTEEQRAGITLDRQRYLAMSNVVLGVPIHTTYGGESSFAGQQLAAAPAFSANTADMVGQLRLGSDTWSLTFPVLPRVFRRRLPSRSCCSPLCVHNQPANWRRYLSRSEGGYGYAGQLDIAAHRQRASVTTAAHRAGRTFQ